jgi:NAD-dependent DNA ligase
MFNLKKGDKMSNKTPTFCITGALDGLKRIDAIVMIHNKTNARWVSMVSSKTDYLISSRKDTRKAKRAKDFGTQVIDQAEMMAFVKKGKFNLPSARV